MFISNAAARYLFPSTNKLQNLHADVDQWLEWESIVLTPALSFYVSDIKNDNVKSILQTCLKKLDTFLTNQQFLVDVSI